MKKTLSEIASLVQGELVGNGDIIVTGISGIKEAREGEITFIANPRYIPLIDETQASCVITSKEVKSCPKPIIRTEDPSLAFARVVSLFFPEDKERHPKSIHPAAAIGKNVTLGKDIAVGPYAVIEDGARLGDRSIVYAGVYIGKNTQVGSDCIIYPQVVVREGITVGSRVIIHSGTIIGSDGFGFATVKGVHQKIAQVGTVVIEDDVEIGANVTIDRARFGKTVIGKGTKIDNLVQVAHNVEVGENSILVAQAGISGSTIIGKNVTLAGQAGIVGHITIGDNAIVAAQAGVTKSVPPNTFVSGYPAKPHHVAKRINACIQRLPILFKLVSSIEKKLENLENKIGKTTYDQKPDST